MQPIDMLSLACGFGLDSVKALYTNVNFCPLSESWIFNIGLLSPVSRSPIIYIPQKLGLIVTYHLWLTVTYHITSFVYFTCLAPVDI